MPTAPKTMTQSSQPRLRVTYARVYSRMQRMMLLRVRAVISTMTRAGPRLMGST